MDFTTASLTVTMEAQGKRAGGMVRVVRVSRAAELRPLFLEHRSEHRHPRADDRVMQRGSGIHPSTSIFVEAGGTATFKFQQNPG